MRESAIREREQRRFDSDTSSRSRASREQRQRTRRSPPSSGTNAAIAQQRNVPQTLVQYNMHATVHHEGMHVQRLVAALEAKSHAENNAGALAYVAQNAENHAVGAYAYAAQVEDLARAEVTETRERAQVAVQEAARAQQSEAQAESRVASALAYAAQMEERARAEVADTEERARYAVEETAQVLQGEAQEAIAAAAREAAARNANDTGRVRNEAQAAIAEASEAAEIAVAEQRRAHREAQAARTSAEEAEAQAVATALRVRQQAHAEMTASSSRAARAAAETAWVRQEAVGAMSTSSSAAARATADAEVVRRQAQEMLRSAEDQRRQAVAEAESAVEEKLNLERERQMAASSSKYWEDYASELSQHVQSLQDDLANAAVVQVSHAEAAFQAGLAQGRDEQPPVTRPLQANMSPQPQSAGTPSSSTVGARQAALTPEACPARRDGWEEPRESGAPRRPFPQ